MAGYTEVLLLVLSSILLYHWVRCKNSKLTNWPILGMLPGLLRNIPRVHEFSTELLKASGGTFVFKGPWFAKLDFVATSDPMNVHHILTKNFTNYPKGQEFNKIFDPLGDGIFNIDMELWKIQRRMIQSSLKQSKFQHFLQTIVRQKVDNGLIPILNHVSETGKEIDLQDVFQRFTFDNICLMVLGFDPVSLSDRFPQVSVQKAFDEMEEALLYRHVVPESCWKLQRWLQIGQEKKLTEAMKTLDRFLYQCISSKRENLKQSRTQGADTGFDLLAECLEEAEDQKGGENGTIDQSNKYLRDVALNLMLAGRDTIGACLTWFFWLVGTHPLVETRILQEIRENLQAKDKNLGVPGIGDLEGLRFLRAALCETLRLYPSVPFNHRNSVLPDVLPSGHPVSQNSKVLLSLYSMGRMVDIWGEDCLEFKPERWLSDQGRILHIPSFKFAAFNAGPRTCLGKELSFTEMKMVAAAIIWNYQIRVVEGHPVLPCPSILLLMKHGLKVRISKRGSQS
ncbi:putative Cytochrome P450 [Quillaja saponaria]|uniref:Cytochrome P450 n=1 Tax=Quillaja saponaria TaxID=32244 RepID=A0AAD7VG47_QUISA|nr:putative Cytochrome P450 [Quillaja saponaria]